MDEEKWTDLERSSCPNHYDFKIDTAYRGCHCPAMINFSQCAFDSNDEALIVIDNNGIAYYIDLIDTPAYRKIGCVGISTFVIFNPIDRNELLIGLSSTNIKVLKINAVNDFCLLTGHAAPPTYVSFYNDYCLTSSSKEVIIWQIKSYSKAHQLRLNAKHIIIKKAAFSSLGTVTVLYQTNIIQSWTFQQFDKDHRIDAQKYGLKIVKDFAYTKNGRVMIICGLQNKILLFNTTTWDLIKNIEIQGNFNGGKHLSVIPGLLDGGSNSTVAILSSDCILKLVNLTTSNVIESCCEIQSGIKKIVVSNKGYYLVCIKKHSILNITLLDKLLNTKQISNTEKVKIRKSLPSHKAKDHLLCIRQAIKEELKLQRLLPILKQFGEYPEKHRRLIWTTIMELPDNRKAYIDLSNKVSHEAVFELLKNSDLLEKYKSSTLGITLSCLLHWCPILAECSFLPKLVAPFVNVFQKNSILGFEASLYILLNYCQKWFEYHPLPPLNILGMIENILLEADSPLFNYFCERGITSTDYAWSMLQTLMSEVLSENNWLILWDHLLSYRKPWFLLMFIVAYNITYRKTIMSELQTKDDFQQFYKTQGHISFKNILKIAHKLDSETPHRIHPRRYLRNNVNIVTRKGPYSPFLQYEFPKYLTDELRGINLKKLKEKERRLRGFQLHAMELLEEKRLQTESENFVKHIHEMRLNELRKCYENQVREDEKLLKYARRQTEESNICKYLNDDVKWNDLNFISRNSTSTDFEKKKKKSKHQNCRLLQEQVERLEFEVQHLLATLHNSSRSKLRIK